MRSVGSTVSAAEEREKLLDALNAKPQPVSSVRLMRMHGRGPDISLSDLQKDKKWQSVSRKISVLERSPELGLGDDEIKS